MDTDHDHYDSNFNEEFSHQEFLLEHKRQYKREQRRTSRKRPLSRSKRVRGELWDHSIEGKYYDKKSGGMILTTRKPYKPSFDNRDVYHDNTPTKMHTLPKRCSGALDTNCTSINMSNQCNRAIDSKSKGLKPRISEEISGIECDLSNMQEDSCFEERNLEQIDPNFSEDCQFRDIPTRVSNGAIHFHPIYKKAPIVDQTKALDQIFAQGIDLNDEFAQINAEENLQKEIYRFHNGSRSSNSLSNFSDSENEQRQFIRQNLANNDCRTPTPNKKRSAKRRRKEAQVRMRGLSICSSCEDCSSQGFGTPDSNQEDMSFDNDDDIIRKEIREDINGFLNAPKLKRCKFNPTQVIKRHDIYDFSDSSSNTPLSPTLNPEEILKSIADTKFEPNPCDNEEDMPLIPSTKHKTPEKSSRQKYLDQKYGRPTGHPVRNLSKDFSSPGFTNKSESLLKAPNKGSSAVGESLGQKGNLERGFGMGYYGTNELSYLSDAITETERSEEDRFNDISDSDSSSQNALPLHLNAQTSITETEIIGVEEKLRRLNLEDQ
ncbi:unnamed protein product [Moneuplotes crassus]|uniref:Uncharacterized protein n=1 Tax=Euplotes crassus TaxID=5936 RepID=A0AAD1U405_EUPCR|nr:unnamed protein product [Moneuplotes crassus]